MSLVVVSIGDGGDHRTVMPAPHLSRTAESGAATTARCEETSPGRLMSRRAAVVGQATRHTCDATTTTRPRPRPDPWSDANIADPAFTRARSRGCGATTARTTAATTAITASNRYISWPRTMASRTDPASPSQADPAKPTQPVDQGSSAVRCDPEDDSSSGTRRPRRAVLPSRRALGHVVTAVPPRQLRRGGRVAVGVVELPLDRSSPSRESSRTDEMRTAWRVGSLCAAARCRHPARFSIESDGGARSASSAVSPNHSPKLSA